jgi:hypothetical protein
MAQTSDKKDKLSVAGKFEKSIKNKEPKFKQSFKKEKEKRGTDEYATFDWIKGDAAEWKRGDDVVYVETVEFDSIEQAISQLQNFVNVPVSLPLSVTKLTNLGDEAYIMVGHTGSTYMFIRKGKVYIRLDASSPALEKRFARHLVDSIDSQE